jgi:hypothetical protein
VHVVRIERRVLEVARRIAIAGLADELQQRLVARAPVEAVRFLGDLAGQLAEPGAQQPGSLMRPQAAKRSLRSSARSTRNQSIRTPMRCWNT